VGFESGQSYSFEQAQQEISRIWAGTIETKWQVQPEALEALRRNPATSECLAEVLREAVSNASKHGQATKIEIALNIQDSAISLQAKDNGTSLNTGKTQGLGTELLDDVCSSWSLEPGLNSGMTLTAKLAIQNH
jgi:nitrate/nitrite-specific signal transduction histidine kinase